MGIIPDAARRPSGSRDSAFVDFVLPLCYLARAALLPAALST